VLHVRKRARARIDKIRPPCGGRGDGGPKATPTGGISPSTSGRVLSSKKGRRGEMGRMAALLWSYATTTRKVSRRTLGIVLDGEGVATTRALRPSPSHSFQSGRSTGMPVLREGAACGRGTVIPANQEPYLLTAAHLYAAPQHIVVDYNATGGGYSVFLALWGRGYAGSCIRTSENFPSR